jgi:hypothetical protein
VRENAQLSHHEEERVDDSRFDKLSRMVGEQTNRRGMLKTAAGGTLALVGLGALGRVALGQDVNAQSNGFEGDDCDNNNDCRKGLECDQDRNRCEYKSNCGGKKGQACKNTGDCCKNKNLKCKNKKCKRNKKNN